MTYVDTDRARSAAVAQAASRETIRFLFQSQVDLARRSVNTAEKGVSDAKKKLGFIAKADVVNPEQTYELLERNLVSRSSGSWRRKPREARPSPSGSARRSRPGRPSWPSWRHS